MADYQDMYLTMVRQTEKAITLTEQALNILIAAQRDCEEIYINSPEPVIQLLDKNAGMEDKQEKSKDGE